MIKAGFLHCPNCKKKIMPISGHDVVFATVSCHGCMSHYRVEIQAGYLKNINREYANV